MIAQQYTLHHGDCLTILPTLAAQSADLILADIPYGTTQCKWDQVIPLVDMWRELKRVRSSRCAIVLFASQPFTSVLSVSNIAEFKHEWIWKKNRGSNFLNARREPFKEHENILVFSNAPCIYHPQLQKRSPKGLSRMQYEFSERSNTQSDHYGEFRNIAKTPSTKDPSLRYPSSVQSFKTQVGLHPTQKPVELLEYLIRTYSNPGDLVVDFTMGSGSTGVAAANTGRRFEGIELYPLLDRPVDKKKNPNYYPLAAERVAAAYARAEQMMMQL